MTACNTTLKCIIDVFEKGFSKGKCLAFYYDCMFLWDILLPNHTSQCPSLGSYILDLRFTKFDIVEPLRIGHPQSSKTMSPIMVSFSVVNFYSTSTQEIGSCSSIEAGVCLQVSVFICSWSLLEIYYLGYWSGHLARFFQWKC